MTFEEKLLNKLRELSPAKQKEVLEFVDSLNASEGETKPLQSLEGLWADLDIHITEEDIAQVRKEMWGAFPRDITL